MNPVFSIKKVLKESFNALIDNFTTLLVRTLQLYVFVFVGAVVFVYGFINSTMLLSSLDMTEVHQFRVFAFLLLILALAGLFILFNLHVQYQRCIWRSLHNQEIPKFRLKDFSLQYLGLNFAFIFIVLVGLVALIIPGIYLFLRLQFADMVLVVERGSINHALRRSWDLTRNLTFKVLLLGLINSIFRVLFIIGYPLMVAIHASAYKQLVDVAHRH